MPAFIKYNSFLKNQMNGAAVVDFNTDTTKIALTTASYVPSATHQFFDDITNEVTGTNYTAGGATITTPAITESAGEVSFTGDNITWAYSATGFTDARTAVLYKDTGTPATSPLIGRYDLATDQSNASVPYSIIFTGGTILKWS